MMRVTDYAQNLLTQYQLNATENQIATLQAQISSGKNGQTFDQIAPQTTQLINLNALSAKLTQYNTNIQSATSMSSAAESTIGNILSLATQAQTTVQNALNTTGASSAILSSQAQSNLNQLVSMLNQQYDGTYLFSGTATNTPPVNLSAPGYTPPGTTYPSTPDTAYYQGNDTPLSVQADDNSNVPYTATADSPGFEELIRGLQLAATTNGLSGTPYTQRVQESLTVIQKAITDITNTQSALGVQQKELNSISAAHSQLLTLTQQQIGDITNVDVSQAATNLSAQETVLQSSLAVTARLSSISLVNYLPPA